jgi:tripartite-type tricarboxylate transporter receptor subunit TctC
MPVLKLLFGLFLIMGLPAPAAADGDYPSRPVRIIVGFGPGSAADFTARVVAQRIDREL